jgi:transposase InsO family protein
VDIYAIAEAVTQDEIASTLEVCAVLDISRSAFYLWKGSIPTTREEKNMELTPKVNLIFRMHRRRYGTRRIVSTLADQGERIGRRRIAKIMKTQGLVAIQPKSFKPRGTESRHRLGYSPNLLTEAQEVKSLNTLWVGDITYIPITEIRFGYLAVLMDRFSRRIVGWKLSDDMTEPLVLETIRMAIANRTPRKGLIHHSDRGGQYAGKNYRSVLRRACIKQSMSRADNCYDNAFMESCFGTLKNELEIDEYKTMRSATKELSEYVGYYNAERKHSSIDYLTPNQFEANQPSKN